MIAFIKGELIAIEQEKVIVEVGGVGYNVFVSSSTIGRLPMEGKEVKLHTYLNIKEDLMQLYGFVTRDELKVFKLIIGVSGIGPKGGLGILSTLSPDALRFAVASNDVKAISAAPGIGKKTAEKLILELKDKLSIEDVLNSSSDDKVPMSGNLGPNIQSDAVQALVALGYGSSEALEAVKQVETGPDATVEDVLKKALKYLM